MFARKAAVFACKAAVLYFIFNLVLTLVENRLPISIAISWHALLGVVLFFIVCFVIDFILRCILNGKKAHDDVSSDAKPIK
ncbi:MAG: hypothetical protein MJZ09_00015 [Bacteroidales bacterium]|nr:hypothetical protein [Bacteroidales bacterium]